MIKITQKGDFSKTQKYLNLLLNKKYLVVAERYAQKGVEALRDATPKDSGLTADSWGYKIESDNNRTAIIFTNSHIEKGVNIAIILNYGHGTRNGGYVQGRDYINPAIQPIFDELVDAAWEEVTKI